MAEIGADYLGGDPAASAGHGAGGKLISQAGEISFRGQLVDATLKSYPVTVAIAKEEIRGISLNSATREVGGIATGKRSHVFLVAGQRDAFDFFARFAVRPDEGLALLNAMQAAQLKRGDQPIARVEDLVGKEGLSAAERQLLILEEIRDRLSEQTELLRTIARGSTP